MTETVVSPSPRNYRKIYADEARRLSQISPVRVCGVVAREWVQIVAAFALPMLTVSGFAGTTDLVAAAPVLSGWQWAVLACVFVFSVLLAACKQHALGVILHDATHFRLLESRSANEWVSNWFCAFPIGFVTSNYRRGHLPHHVFTNKQADPYWVRLSKDPQYAVPMSRRAFARIVARDVLGLNWSSLWPIVRYWTGWPFILRNDEKLLTPSERVQFALFWILATGLVVWSGIWPYFLVVWLFPMFTVSLAFIRMRIIAEHDLAQQHDELIRTRHVDGTWLERFALAPLSINFHIAHHLFPSVPLYNLPELHALLVRDEEFSSKAQLWRTYWGREDGLLTGLIRG